MHRSSSYVLLKLIKRHIVTNLNGINNKRIRFSLPKSICCFYPDLQVNKELNIINRTRIVYIFWYTVRKALLWPKKKEK